MLKTARNGQEVGRLFCEFSEVLYDCYGSVL